MVDITPINVGAAPNDGSGDKGRDAWIKVNANAAALKSAIEDISDTVSGLAEAVPRVGATIPLTARGALLAGRFVAAYGERQAVPVTPANTASATGRAIGYLEHAAADGDAIAVRVSGPASVPGAAWATGLPVYLADDGSPTVARRTSGLDQVVGTTTGATTFVVAIGPAVLAETVVALVTLDSVRGVVVQALTDVIASLSLAPPDQPGVVWRNNTFPSLSPNADGTPYTTTVTAGAAGALDPITALLPIAVPLALRTLPVDPPSAAGALWLNNGRLALSPALDGTPYPVTPLPSAGAGLLQAVRAALPPWLTATLPALPPLSPLSVGALWRSTHLLAIS